MTKIFFAKEGAIQLALASAVTLTTSTVLDTAFPGGSNIVTGVFKNLNVSALPIGDVNKVDFIGVDASFHPDVDTHHNIGGVPKSRFLYRMLFESKALRAARPYVPPAVGNVFRRVRGQALAPAPPLPDTLRDHLREIFRDDIVATSRLIDRDLSSWLS